MYKHWRSQSAGADRRIANGRASALTQVHLAGDALLVPAEATSDLTAVKTYSMARGEMGPTMSVGASIADLAIAPGSRNAGARYPNWATVPILRSVDEPLTLGFDFAHEGRATTPTPCVSQIFGPPCRLLHFRRGIFYCSKKSGINMKVRSPTSGPAGGPTSLRLIARCQCGWCNAEGGLSERARQRAMELANDADLRLTAPKETVRGEKPKTPALVTDERLPAPGSVITRRYKGQDLEVKVLVDGFEFEGEVFPSLSAVAKAINGSHCNGYLFFGLAKRGAK